MKTYKTLRALFKDKSRWTKRHMARDKTGRCICPTDPSAVKFCLLGGIRKVYGYSVKAREVIDKLYNQFHPAVYRSLTQFNDNNTYSTVYKAVIKAKV